MDVNPMDTVEAAREEGAASRLNTWVAVAVALLATFMGICKVKDDNIVQAMQQAQADKIDHWSFYQARNIREEIAKGTLTTLQLAAATAPDAARAGYADAIARYETFVHDEDAKKQDVRKQAEDDQATYDALNVHDDQFDLSDALIAIAISLYALTSLTRKRWLFIVALVPSGFGVLMGCAGLFGWGLHPGWLTSLLS